MLKTSKEDSEFGRVSEPGFLDRLKVRFGFAETPSIRSTLEYLVRRGKEADGTFSVVERMMLQNILRFGALRVEDVMVPRADIVAIDESACVDDLLRLFGTAGHSRIPVYKETLDEPVGMVHIKDLMSWIIGPPGTDKKESGSLSVVQENDPSALGVLDGVSTDGNRERQHQTDKIDLNSVDLTESIAQAKVKRGVLFVPPSMPVIDLLLRMQTTRVHLALVVDEYGGTEGLLSIEDLVEEIVGEIEDEHDVLDGPLLQNGSGNALIADARTPIEELEERLNVDLNLPDRDDDDVDTLGGLIFSMAGRVPVRGELIAHPTGIEFEVLDADPRRIKKLRVHLVRSNNKSTKAH